MSKPKDVIIDPEWEQDNELRGAWDTRRRMRETEPESEDLDPFGVHKPEAAILQEPQDLQSAVENTPSPKQEYRNAEPVHEEVDEFAEPQKFAPSKLETYIGMLLSGSILNKAEARKVYPYMILVAFLVLVYISSVFRMQQLRHREQTLTRQIKELRAISIEYSSERMKATRQSNILLELEKRQIPLKELTVPPKSIE